MATEGGRLPWFVLVLFSIFSFSFFILYLWKKALYFRHKCVKI